VGIFHLEKNEQNCRRVNSETMRKEHSTNTINKKQLERDCNMAYTITQIGARWKPSILASLLRHKKLRYSELRKMLPFISQRMLSLHLKELEQDQLIRRKVLKHIPPKVEYTLTARGTSLKPLLQSLDIWGASNRPANIKPERPKKSLKQ